MVFYRNCLLNLLFRCRSKKTSELRITGLCAGNPSVTGEFPAQMGSNMENVSIRWHHHIWNLPHSYFQSLHQTPYLHLFLVINYCKLHYDDVIMSAIASQITSLTIVYSTVYPGADQNKHQSSVSLAFEWGIHRGPVNSPHKWPVTRKMFPFDDVIMYGKSLENKIVRF